MPPILAVLPEVEHKSETLWAYTARSPHRIPTKQAIYPGFTSPPTLVVRLLGAPVVHWGPALIDIPRRQARALFYYLAATSQRVPRSQLCWLFWPEEAEPVAKQKLARVLYHLRCALPDKAVLAVDSEAVWLEPAAVVCDRSRLAKLWENTVYTRQHDVTPEMIGVYGGQFLAGFTLDGCPEFERWLRDEAQTCEQQYLSLLKAYTLVLKNKHQLDSAIICAEHYLAIDHLDEDVHRLLISLYAAVGNNAASSRQFDRCVDLLASELDVSPSQATWDAYYAISS